MQKIKSFAFIVSFGGFVSYGFASLVGIFFPNLKELVFLIIFGIWIFTGREYASAINLFH